MKGWPEWYVIMSGHPFIKALAAYWGGAFVQGLRCHFISMPGKSPMKLEVTSLRDHSCLLGRKESKQNKTMLLRYASYLNSIDKPYKARFIAKCCSLPPYFYFFTNIYGNAIMYANKIF